MKRRPIGPSAGDVGIATVLQLGHSVEQGWLTSQRSRATFFYCVTAKSYIIHMNIILLPPHTHSFAQPHLL